MFGLGANVESFSKELEAQLDSLTDEERETKLAELDRMYEEYQQAVADITYEVIRKYNALIAQ